MNQYYIDAIEHTQRDAGPLGCSPFCRADKYKPIEIEGSIGLRPVAKLLYMWIQTTCMTRNIACTYMQGSLHGHARKGILRMRIKNPHPLGRAFEGPRHALSRQWDEKVLSRAPVTPKGPRKPKVEEQTDRRPLRRVLGYALSGRTSVCAIFRLGHRRHVRAWGTAQSHSHRKTGSGKQELATL